MTVTLQALSLVEKAELVKVHFTLCSRDQWSKWMQDGYKVYMDSYMVSKGSCVHGYLDYYQKSSLRSRPNTKPGDHGTPDTPNR